LSGTGRNDGFALLFVLILTTALFVLFSAVIRAHYQLHELNRRTAASAQQRADNLR